MTLPEDVAYAAREAGKKLNGQAYDIRVVDATDLGKLPPLPTADLSPKQTKEK